jgi:hypothetical protein
MDGVIDSIQHAGATAVCSSSVGLSSNWIGTNSAVLFDEVYLTAIPGVIIVAILVILALRFER